MGAARRVLERLEDTLRTAVESVGHLLPGKLEPLELAAELARAMDHRQMQGLEGTIAPNEYRVKLSPDDLRLLGMMARELENELSQYLSEFAAERSCLVGPVLTVKLEPDQRLATGRVRVEADFADHSLPARLEVISGIEPRVLEFVGEADIGRSEECCLPLEDAAISRRHARLVWTYSGYLLEDLGSSNGTFVDGRKVDRILLSGGELIEIGLVQMRFSYVR
ncbi:MAG: DUF3662 and FHA domain-containing protein [candidate division WS1 bacterium]|jgi:hypothetical protein|nr:DUF3662 and FHA domain-containing protein [candidate division WS1 bacterium]